MHFNVSGWSGGDRAAREGLLSRFQPLKLPVYLWTGLVDRVVGGRNNPIKINPMIKLPEASNSSRVYLNADQRHIVQSAGRSLEVAEAAPTPSGGRLQYS